MSSSLSTSIRLVCLVSILIFFGCVNSPGVGVFSSDTVKVAQWPGAGAAGSDNWYYMPVDESTCANGTSTGLGLNIGEDQRDVVIYLSGGGACWDSASCRYFQTASNLKMSYDSTQFGIEVHPLFEAGLFDRRAEVNPFKDASYAYVPYCTGDLHTGRRMTAYDGFGGGELLHHRGADNLGYFLDILPEVFPDVERVFLVGISAGGYGITWNFEHFKAAFPETEIHVFSDASPWLKVEDDRWEKWQQNWGLKMPKGCPQCSDRPDYLPLYLSRTYPETRFAMSVFSRDTVMSAYLGVMPGKVESSIADFVEERFSQENTAAFIADGSSHEVLLKLSKGVTAADGEKLVDFLRRWVDGVD